ncbi:hypothetical protein BD31_I1308, partial [Candidatus Nitrosopumilus salaria BD31]
MIPGSKSIDENPGWSTKIYLLMEEVFDQVILDRKNLEINPLLETY